MGTHSHAVGHVECGCDSGHHVGHEEGYQYPVEELGEGKDQYHEHCKGKQDHLGSPKSKKEMVVLEGIEPSTPRL